MSVLDEAYERFARTGPEWGEDRLTNHGPMAAEVLVRRGHADEVHEWIDGYIRRLDDAPSAGDPVTDATWREALGDERRIGDWTAYLTRQASEGPWQELLARWWPRLIPSVIAGATHGVIRTSHAVRTLMSGDESPAAVTELAHGLAFWAARAMQVPGATPPAGELDPAAAVDALPRIPVQEGDVASRFGQIAEMPGWPPALAALRAPADPDDVPSLLAGLVHAMTIRYLTHGHASPVLLVHTATAPNAVLAALPALPKRLWAGSLSAVWAASAAIMTAYAPAVPAPRDALPVVEPGGHPEVDVLDRAAAHGDEHVIKFSDVAADVYARTGDPDALAACVRIGTLVDSPLSS
jgi:hypothetical protein